MEQQKQLQAQSVSRSPGPMLRAGGQDGPKVGIVGGTGRMGSWFADLSEQFGLEVLRVGRKTPLTPEEMAPKCDVVVISVPISSTVEVIKKIGPLVPDNSLLMDLTSIKERPMEAMLKYSRAQVVGAHPLFGPDVAEDHQARVVLCPGRGEQGLAWLRGILERAGLEVVLLSPERHDHIMGLVQGVNHFSTFALALCISQSGLKFEDLMNCSTHTFKQKLERIQAVMAQPEDLFGSLLMDNPEAGRFIEQYLNAADDLIGVVREKDRCAFSDICESLKKFHLCG